MNVEVFTHLKQDLEHVGNSLFKKFHPKTSYQQQNPMINVLRQLEFLQKNIVAKVRSNLHHNSWKPENSPVTKNIRNSCVSENKLTTAVVKCLQSAIQYITASPFGFFYVRHVFGENNLVSSEQSHHSGKTVDGRDSTSKIKRISGSVPSSKILEKFQLLQRVSRNMILSLSCKFQIQANLNRKLQHACCQTTK